MPFFQIHPNFTHGGLESRKPWAVCATEQTFPGIVRTLNEGKEENP